jgi:ribosomal protein S27AE
MVYFADSPVTTTARPFCPKCGAPMRLTRIEPDKPGFARRSFECPRCQRQVTEVIELKNRSLAGAGPAPLAAPHHTATIL